VLRILQIVTMRLFIGLSIFVTAGLFQSACAERLLITFSANLDSTGGCHRDDPTGADLYTVVLDLEQMEVNQLTRVTHKPLQAEWFPSLSPDGRWILFNHTRFAPRAQAVLSYDRYTKREHVLLHHARFPHWYSNKGFYYTKTLARRDCYYARITWKEAKLEVAESRPVTTVNRCPGTSLASDPSPFPDDLRIAFHVLRGRAGAAVAMINTDGTAYRRITPWNGSGHVDVSPSGNFLVFSMASSGRPRLARKADQWSDSKPLPLSTDPQDWLSYDRRYGSVDRVGWDYGEWAASDHRILFSAQGYSRRRTGFSRVFLLTFTRDFSKAQIFDLSSAVEALTSKAGRDFCTAFAVVLRNSR